MALPNWNESTLNAGSRTFTRSGNSPLVALVTSYSPGNMSAVICSGIGESYWLEVAIHCSHIPRVPLFIKRHQK